MEPKAMQNNREKMTLLKFARERIVLCSVLPAITFLLFAAPCALWAAASTVEDGVIRFIKQYYDDGENVYVRFNNLPEALQEKARVRHIDFVKIPDSKGNGLCLVEIEGRNNRAKTVYVSFKVQSKRKLFVLKQTVRRGDTIRSGDLLVKDTFVTEDGGIYPTRIDDVIGKVAKRDLAAGATVTSQVLEDSFAVQRGDTVDIVADNKRLSVQAKGITLEKGKLGDRVRVKNLTSDKEVVGRVTGNGVVRVDL